MKEIDSSELFRLQTMSFHENRLRSNGFSLIAGVDEAGRGPLAGPVVAAACILHKNTLFAKLNDSKKLSKKDREALYHEITTTPSIIYGIGIVDAAVIDEMNILNATLLAMRHAVKALSLKPDYVLVDGNKLPGLDVAAEAIVKGDSLSVSIAAASIIAKVTRDQIMEEFDVKWPQYGFKQHSGYGTKGHVEAIYQYGPSAIHRKSFEPIKSLCLR